MNESSSSSSGSSPFRNGGDGAGTASWWWGGLGLAFRWVALGLWLLWPAGVRAEGGGYEPPRFGQADRVERVKALAGEVEALFRGHAAELHIPGVAWAVVVDGEPVVVGCHGVGDVGSGSPVTPGTVFRVASMTKSLTAMAVLRLRDEGRLDLDRPVSRHLPEMRRLRLLTTDAPAITPRHLLTHSAGFPEDNPWGDRQLSDTDGDLVALVRGGPSFSNVPGVEYEYSNLGFALLGRLVARAGGMRCQDYLDARVLGPLGMRSTYWDPARVPSGRLARGYRWEEGAWREEEQLGDGSYASMGGMLSTVEDFARYMAVHLGAWPPRDDAESGPVRRSSVREMQQAWRMAGMDAGATDAAGRPCPVVRAYGYGLRVTVDCKGRMTVGHSGGLPGFGSDWRVMPAYGVGVVSFGNRTYCRMGGPTAKALELVVEKGGLRAREIPVSKVLGARASALARMLPDWSGAEASGLFAENFFPDQSEALRRRTTRELFAKVGPVLEVGPVEPENQLRGTFRVRGEKGTLEVFLTLTPEPVALIQEVRISEAAGDGKR